MATWKLPSFAKWLLIALLALTPVIASGCRSSGVSSGRIVGSDGHAGHSH